MTELETMRLILRDFQPKDAPAIVACLNDMDMCRGLTVVSCPYTLADAEWYIAKGSQDALAVCTRDGTLIGAMGLGKQLGYWIAKPQWARGYASEAATAVLARHFAKSDAPVSSGYVDDNFGSARVLEKLGFEIVGDKPLFIRSRGKEVPGKAVSLSKTRWEAVQWT